MASDPGVLGPWWKATQTFVLGSRLIVRERPLIPGAEGVREVGMTCLDGTNIRARRESVGS